ncbi:hypothetical protein PPERSA_09329 [Pseudocohnilembus persalinus]|uniref:Cation efflux protein n=1 Tax=Pseudocohnilembus persalinus TaxID=266149 RepID=A0A0V0QXZ0_PSEPJ|nr:hypothetical protein PPERSA_09329 [Pseudocohnilembus persalinus]|eukprot:KRX07115.1 hypothetical protein PPERSA_09329 [Pseudocohnilembus persalinus]
MPNNPTVKFNNGALPALKIQNQTQNETLISTIDNKNKNKNKNNDINIYDGMKIKQKAAQIFEDDDDEKETTYGDEEIALYQQPNVDEEKQNVMKLLIIVAIISLFFTACQLVGGYLANSLAIMADAAHIFSDVSGFVISIIAIKLSKISASKKMSFGYHRAEILGALTSVLVIWGLTVWLIVEAVDRIINPEDIERLTMLITAILGLVFNLIQFKMLHNPKFSRKSVGGHACAHDHGHGHGHSHNHDHKHEHKNKKEVSSDCKTENCKKSSENAAIEMNSLENKQNIDMENQLSSVQKTDQQQQNNNQENEQKKLAESEKKSADKKKAENLNLRAAMIHVLGDLLQSVGLVIAAIIVYIGGEDFQIVDPISTFIFALIVLYTTKSVFKESIAILMEGSPNEVEVDKLEEELKQIEGVKEIHDLHVWALSPSKLFLSVHISTKLDDEDDPRKTLCLIRNGKPHKNFQTRGRRIRRG